VAGPQGAVRTSLGVPPEVTLERFGTVTAGRVGVAVGLLARERLDQRFGLPVRPRPTRPKKAAQSPYVCIDDQTRLAYGEVLRERTGTASPRCKND